MDAIASGTAAHMDQMASIVEGVTEELRKQWGSFSAGCSEGFWDPILRFVHAVDWTEPWLMGLMVFHVAVFVLAVLTRKQGNVQAGIFFSVLISIYMAERLNSFLQHHWQRFASQPYFDAHGVFLSTVWSGPLLLVSTLILVNSLFAMVSLMVKWKRAELKHRARTVARGDSNKKTDKTE